MKFFTEEAFRNKLIGLLGVLVLFLSQNYVEEVIGSKNAYKSNLYVNFELYVNQLENLDTYLTSVQEINNINEIRPVYIENSVITLMERNRMYMAIVQKKSVGSEYFFDAIDVYSRVNKNIEAVISDDSVSEKELIYIKELSKFNRANLENAKQLIEYDNNNYDERKKLEKEIFEIYKEHIEFMSKAYEKSSPENLKLQMEVAKEENNITKESVREELAKISKRVTGLDTLSYFGEPYADERYSWSYTTKKDPKSLDRTDEDVYTFEYVIAENKVNFYQSYRIFNEEQEELTEDKMRALADEHINKLGIGGEFVSSEKNKYEYVSENQNRDFDYMTFYYNNKDNDIYNESSNIEVKVEKNGRLDSSFYLVTSEPKINWADESLVKEKFNNESKIQSIIKVVNSKNEGEFLVMTKEEDKLYIYVYDGESAELKLYDKLDKDRHPFYHRILM